MLENVHCSNALKAFFTKLPSIYKYTKHISNAKFNVSKLAASRNWVALISRCLILHLKQIDGKGFTQNFMIDDLENIYWTNSISNAPGWILTVMWPIGDEDLNSVGDSSEGSVLELIVLKLIRMSAVFNHLNSFNRRIWLFNVLWCHVGVSFLCGNSF